MADVRKKEEVYEEVEVPDCFSYHDSKDPSCRRCSVRFLCMDEQNDNRPPCFGEGWDEENLSCQACLHSSQCVENLTEDSKMARKIKVRRRQRPAKEPVVETKAVEAEVDVAVEDEAMDYASWSVPELRSECEERDLPAGGRKVTLVKRLIANDGYGEEEAPPVAKPAVARRRSRKVAAPEVQEVADTPVAVGDILSIFEEGKSVLITRVGDNEWLMASFGGEKAAKSKGAGLRGAAYEKEVYSEEFMTFYYTDAGEGKAWKDMTPEERYAFADAISAEWQEHENTKTDQMRMGQAVREALEVPKYKEQYQTRAARKAMRG